MSDKGKEQAVVDAEFQDLFPVLTYRHALSFTLGVKDPLRVVALCDLDAFYASCEMVRLGVDQQKPLVVLQWESIIAVNYPARKFGITRMAKISEAKKLCPELVVVHVATFKEGETEPGYWPWSEINSRTHKVSLDYYRRESLKVLTLFKEGLPGGEIEKASIDEAFLDLTKPTREILLQRYPQLAQLPPGATQDTPLPPAPSTVTWDNTGTLVPVKPAPKSDADDSAVPCDLEPDAYPPTWHDVCLAIGAELMNQLRRDIHAKLGYTTSAGIARNKFLAKLCASYQKFDNQSILRNSAIPNYLRPMAFQKIRFLGGKLGDAIAKEYESSFIADLLSIPLDEMQRRFGENSIWVWEVLRGIDRSEVKEKAVTNKSMMASKNLPTPITKASEGQHWLRVLAAELALRLNEARKTSLAIWPKSLVLHIRQGYETSRSRQVAFPFVKELTVDVIASLGDRLWKELVGDVKAPIKVTSVQLTFSGIEAAETGQRNIEGFFAGATAGPSSPKKRLRDVDATAEEKEEATPAVYICPRCDKRIALSFDEREAGSTQVEHEDYHFAQDLARSAGSWKAGGASSGSSTQPAKKKQKKKRVEKAEGIAKFFAPRK